ncbi:MAG TPA: hypothetical protein PLK95_03320 [Pseudothermotoga sp.]|nr:hypothetical protein [Pseudothermotoga sp.]HPP69745.1 hypothetical protein [Pseudothermotoga sp.]
MIQLLFFKLAVLIILSLVLVRVARHSIRIQKKLRMQVQKTLQEKGWSRSADLYYGKSWIAVYQKLLYRQIVLVNEDLLTFDELRKAVIMALLSNVSQMKIYCNQITPHARKALHMLSKSRKVHGIKLDTRESVRC